MKRHGFTLTEMLVVISIMAIMAMMMLPTIAPLYRDRAITASVSKVQGAIMKARSLAAQHNAVYYLAFTYFNDRPNMVVIYTNDYDPTANGWSANWTTAADRKKMLAAPPVLLDERTKFNFSVTQEIVGEECYFKMMPNGEIIRGGTYADLTKCVKILPSRVNQIKIYEAGGGDDAKFETINIMMLTGSMYKDNE